MKTILETNLPLKLSKRGKVRDIYEIDDERLLIVSTDRISAFDWVMHEGIPGRGRVLNQLSCFWFRRIAQQLSQWESLRFHFLGDDIGTVGLVKQEIEENDLAGRSMIARKMDTVIPIECIVRRYLVGSAWKEYQASGRVCGFELPEGFRRGERLPYPIFTPSTKAEEGHDQNISREEMIRILDEWRNRVDGMPIGFTTAQKLVHFLEGASVSIFLLGSEYARVRGILIADTKFEFGIKDGEIFLIDEILTPDSSRFWDEEEYLRAIANGRAPKSFDKQYLRDWLESTGWDKNSPPPHLPQEVIEETRRRYEIIFRRLTGGGEA